MHVLGFPHSTEHHDIYANQYRCRHAPRCISVSYAGLTLTKHQIFFNVMWKYLGQQSFHLSEQEYLEHLQVRLFSVSICAAAARSGADVWLCVCDVLCVCASPNKQADIRKTPHDNLTPTVFEFSKTKYLQRYAVQYSIKNISCLYLNGRYGDIDSSVSDSPVHTLQTQS